MYKVIFHLDDEEKGTTIINNINNLFKDMKEAEEEVEVEILANASGVKALKKENIENKEAFTNLLEKEVKMAICNNTINNLGLSKEDIIEGCTLVTSGVGELVRKQHEGWAYIKP